jgi:hypothetical protein
LFDENWLNVIEEFGKHSIAISTFKKLRKCKKTFEFSKIEIDR